MLGRRLWRRANVGPDDAPESVFFVVGSPRNCNQIGEVISGARCKLLIAVSSVGIYLGPRPRVLVYPALPQPTRLPHLNFI